MTRIESAALLAAILLVGGVFMIVGGFYVDEPVQQNRTVEDCQAFRVTGDPARKADILLVAKDYTRDAVWRQDFTYFMDFDGDNRGLFGVYPFNVSRDRFNVWVVDAGDGIGDWQQGLVTDATTWFDTCPFTDYQVVLAKKGMGRSAFTLPGHRVFVKDVHRKVKEDRGAAGLLHEWGHAFGQLKDEYYSVDGRSAPGVPNCADNLSQARQWWGGLAETHPRVDYYRGCSYSDDNWRPHRRSVMGNGGKWRYGPVNDRRLLTVLSRYE